MLNGYPPEYARHFYQLKESTAIDNKNTLFFTEPKNFIHILKTTDINMIFNKKNLLSGHLRPERRFFHKHQKYPIISDG